MGITDFNSREYYISRDYFRGVLMLPFRDMDARYPITPSGRRCPLAGRLELGNKKNQPEETPAKTHDGEGEKHTQEFRQKSVFQDLGM